MPLLVNAGATLDGLDDRCMDMVKKIMEAQFPKTVTKTVDGNFYKVTLRDHQWCDYRVLGRDIDEFHERVKYTMRRDGGYTFYDKVTTI